MQFVGVFWVIISILAITSGLLTGKWIPLFRLDLRAGLSTPVTVAVLCIGIMLFWSGWSLRRGRTRFAGALLVLLVLLLIGSIVHVARFGDSWGSPVLYLLATVDCAIAWRANRQQARRI